MTYCHSCDKYISNKFINKHNKSKTHLYFHKNFVINKYYIGDIFFKDFENIIRDYINEYNNKFNSFSILINFNLNKENMNVSIDNIHGEIPLYKFKDSSSIINNVILTIFSKYKTMKRNYLLTQPRPVLV